MFAACKQKTNIRCNILKAEIDAIRVNHEIMWKKLIRVLPNLIFVGAENGNPMP